MQISPFPVLHKLQLNNKDNIYNWDIFSLFILPKTSK